MPARLLSILMSLVFGGGILGSCSESDPAPLPAISSFSPVAGSVFTEVTISGINFSLEPGQNDVRFNGVRAQVTASTPSQITAVVPQDASSGVITITVNGQSCVSETHFIVNPLLGQWRFTGAASTNCTDPIEEGVVACSFDCPTLIFQLSTITFSYSTNSYTYAYSIFGTKLTIESNLGTLSPSYVVSGDYLTLVYPPGNCAVTETYVKI